MQAANKVNKYALLSGFKIKKIVYIKYNKEEKFRNTLVHYGEKENKLIKTDKDKNLKMMLVYQDFHRGSYVPKEFHLFIINLLINHEVYQNERSFQKQ